MTSCMSSPSGHWRWPLRRTEKKKKKKRPDLSGPSLGPLFHRSIIRPIPRPRSNPNRRRLSRVPRGSIPNQTRVHSGPRSAKPFACWVSHDSRAFVWPGSGPDGELGKKKAKRRIAPDAEATIFPASIHYPCRRHGPVCRSPHETLIFRNRAWEIHGRDNSSSSKPSSLEVSPPLSSASVLNFAPLHRLHHCLHT